MTSVEIQAAILKALRANARGRDYVDVADEIDQAPFRVRAELRVLRRNHLVRDYMAPGRARWCLTAPGWAFVYEADRLEMTS